jgi:hypothetical protein
MTGDTAVSAWTVIASETMIALSMMIASAASIRCYMVPGTPAIVLEAIRLIIIDTHTRTTAVPVSSVGHDAARREHHKGSGPQK